MLRIKKSEFVTSVGKNGGYPSEGGAEIAIVGKSNVRQIVNYKLALQHE